MLLLVDGALVGIRHDSEGRLDVGGDFSQMPVTLVFDCFDSYPNCDSIHSIGLVQHRSEYHPINPQSIDNKCTVNASPTARGPYKQIYQNT